jgi:hypothetical protein
MLPYVPQGTAAQEGIGDGVQQDIRIRVTHQTHRMRNVHTPQYQGSPWNQGMDVKPLAHSHLHGIEHD